MVFIALLVSGAAHAEIETTLMLCEGKLPSPGIDPDQKVVLLLQKLYPTGDEQVRLAIGGKEVVAPEKALVARTLNSVQSPRISLGIRRAQITSDTDKVILKVDNKLVNAYLSCKEFANKELEE